MSQQDIDGVQSSAPTPASRGESLTKEESEILNLQIQEFAQRKKQLLLDQRHEPLLQESEDRFVCFPLDPDFCAVWFFYKQHEAAFWTAEEIDFALDIEDWKNLSDEERQYISHTLAFFAIADGIVAENAIERLYSEIQVTEVRFFYAFQLAMENIHAETYSLLIDTFIKNPQEKQKILSAAQTFPSVKKKSDWALRWMCGSQPFVERLVAFVCVEGIFFSGSFCSIFWFKKRGLMPGLTFSNELISRDEGLHCKHAAYLYRTKVVEKLSRQRLLEILCEAVEYEKEFVCGALPKDMPGMNSDLMSQYIEFVGDVTLGLLGYEKHYNAENPFDWMDIISLQGKTNFFEKRVGEYKRSKVLAAGIKQLQNFAEKGKLSKTGQEILNDMRLKGLASSDDSGEDENGDPGKLEPDTTEDVSDSQSLNGENRGNQLKKSLRVYDFNRDF